LGNTGTDGRII